jgi:hypothetical protein
MRYSKSKWLLVFPLVMASLLTSLSVRASAAEAELSSVTLFVEGFDIEENHFVSVDDGVPENNIEAVRWFRLAAEQGYDLAQFNLGNMYRDGDGVPENDVEAVKWYRLAAEQGQVNAQNELGLLYSSGVGVPENDVKAYV